MKYQYTPVYQIVKDGEVVDEWYDRKEATGRAKAAGATVRRVLREEVIMGSEFAQMWAANLEAEKLRALTAAIFANHFED